MDSAIGWNGGNLLRARKSRVVTGDMAKLLVVQIKPVSSIWQRTAHCERDMIIEWVSVVRNEDLAVPIYNVHGEQFSVSPCQPPIAELTPR